MQYNIPDVSTLRRIRSLSELNNEQLIALANQLQIYTARKGDFLLERGSVEDSSLYVTKGKVDLIASDGHTKHIDISENETLTPIAQLRPCIYDIEAQETVRYLKINKQKLIEFAQLTEIESDAISVHSLHLESGDYAHLFIHDLFRNIMSNEIELPSLPEVAIEISELRLKPDVDQLSRLLLSYPEFSKKLIRKEIRHSTNSQQIREEMKIIAARLGIETSYYMIMTHVINRLLDKPDEKLSKKLPSLQDHSLNVAAMSRVLAREANINPDKAMLAGMSHCVGNIVIIDFLQHNVNFNLDTDETIHAIEKVRPEITGLLLNRWQFESDIVQVAHECGDWFRNPQDDIDICDVVLVANYHSLMRLDYGFALPPILSIPAMNKLGIHQKKSFELIKKSILARQKIEKLLQ